MKILNFGSLNIDRVYSVDHFVAAGETLPANKMETFSGGKGLNQSVALARAGACVYHAGAIGPDGEDLRELLRDAGVHTDYLQQLDLPNGHAIIQVTPSGQNCIIVCAGANGALSEEYIDGVLEHFGAGDLLLVQNETSNVAYAMTAAKKHGMKIAFNASPITPALLSYPLDLVDWYLINEVEGKALAACGEADNETILAALERRFPQAGIVLTVGRDGVLYSGGGQRAAHGIYKVPVVDTTAAGDTFCGFFLAALASGRTPAQALRTASLASSLAVSRRGAAPSIPTLAEAERFGETAATL